MPASYAVTALVESAISAVQAEPTNFTLIMVCARLPVVEAMFFAVLLLAQAEQSRISGLVTDSSGATVPDIAVQLVKAESGAIQATTRTSDHGTFEFHAESGLYNIAVAGFVRNGFGFRSATMKAVRVASEAVDVAPIRLDILSPCGIRIEPVSVLVATPPTPRKPGLVLRLLRRAKAR